MLPGLGADIGDLVVAVVVAVVVDVVVGGALAPVELEYGRSN